MSKFRKKPVEIEAMQWRGVPNPLAPGGGEEMDYLLLFDEWITEKDKDRKCRYRGSNLIIPTLEGDMEASPADWIICGIKGELYPCKPDIFAATYEPVE